VLAVPWLSRRAVKSSSLLRACLSDARRKLITPAPGHARKPVIAISGLVGW